MNRYWRLDSRIVTSRDLRASGVSPLRCVNLGRCETRVEALARGRKAGDAPAAVISRNVRLACDSGRGALYGLTGDQIAELRAGNRLKIRDSLGEFIIGYAPAMRRRAPREN